MYSMEVWTLLCLPFALSCSLENLWRSGVPGGGDFTDRRVFGKECKDDRELTEFGEDRVFNDLRYTINNDKLLKLGWTEVRPCATYKLCDMSCCADLLAAVGTLISPAGAIVNITPRSPVLLLVVEELGVNSSQLTL